MKGNTLREWIAIDSTRYTISRQFERFLQGYLNEKGENIYYGRINSMCQGSFYFINFLFFFHWFYQKLFFLKKTKLANGESLEVSYLHLQNSNPLLALYLANAPFEILKIFDEVAKKVVLVQFPEYHRIHSEVHVRIADLPSHDLLRELRYFFIYLIHIFLFISSFL